MDYFQQIISTYKDRKGIKEAQDNSSQYLQAFQQAANIAKGLVGQKKAITMDSGVPVGTSNLVKAYVSKTKDGFVAGLSTPDGQVIPGSQSRAIRISTAETDPNVQIEIGKLLLGAQDQQSQPDQTQEEDPQQMQQDPMAQMPMVDPHIMEMDNAGAQLAEQTRQLVENGAIVSTGEKGYVGKYFSWVKSSFNLKDIFFGKKHSLTSKLLNNTELSPEQQMKAMEVMGDYVDTIKRLHATPDSVGIDDIKKFRDSNLIQFGAGLSNNQIRINVGNDDQGRPQWATFRWHAGEGVQRNTGIWKHLGESFDILAERRGQDLGISSEEMKSLYLPERKRFTAYLENVGAYNQIVGDIGEQFGEIFNIFLNAQAYKDIGELDKATEVGQLGAAKLQTLLSKYGVTSLKALRGYEAFMTGKLAVTDSELASNQGLSDILKEMHPTVEKSIRSLNHKLENGQELTEQEFQNLTAAYRQYMLTSLGKINMNYLGVMQPKYVVRVGTSERNGKKTDQLLVYKNEAEAKAAIKRLMPIDAVRNATPRNKKEPEAEYEARIAAEYQTQLDAAYQKFANQGSRVREMYSGDMAVGDLVQDTDVVIHTGLKTSIDDRGATVGSSSVKQTEENLTESLSPQSQTMYERIAREHGVSVDAVQKIVNGAKKSREKIASVVAKVKEAQKKGEFPDSTMKQVKALIRDSDLDLELDGTTKPDNDQINDILTELTGMEDRVMFKTITEGAKGRGQNKQAHIATLDAVLSNASCGEEQAQLMISCSLESGNVKISDQNGIRESFIEGIKSGDIELVESEGGNLSFVRCKSGNTKDGCEGRTTLGTFSVHGGRYTLDVGKVYLSELGKRFSGKPETRVRESVNTFNILDLLIEQRNMLTSLIMKYQK